jgi:glucose-1-phosphate adenylyltransferase
MSTPSVIAFVLAGGEGKRLRPLTDDCPKPAIEVAHGLRIVDFVLANLVNSGVTRIHCVAQYKPARLVEHVARVWRPAIEKAGGSIRCAASAQEYRGTADAVWRNRELLAEKDADIVAVFAADHVYRMDVRQMMKFHLERRADLTVAATRVPLAEARRFGVLRTLADGRVADFQEKPERPAALRHDPLHAFASMGNYLFEPIALIDLLEESIEAGGADFGHDVLPHAVQGGRRVFAYDFSTNRVPGVRWYEDAVYWRDVGTAEALAAARHDVQGRNPRFDPRNPRWPIRPAVDVDQYAARPGA